MATLLPILSLFLVVALLLITRSDSASRPERGAGAASAWALGLSALLLLAAYIWQGWGSDPVQASLGFVLGSLAAAAWRILPAAARQGGAWGIAAVCTSLIRWMPTEWHIHAQLGLIAGGAMASWLLQVRAPSTDGSSAFAIAACAAAAADLMGAKSGTQGFNYVGTLFACAGAASVLLSSIFRLRNAARPMHKAIALVALALIVFAIGQRYLGTQHLWILFVAGMILGLVSDWLLDEEGVDALRPLIAAILWIGLATLAFALRRGLGMSLGFMGGAATLIILGNSRALLTLGPFAGLVMYRVFREEHVSATRALDIGQHYALIGLLTGALLPLCAIEWLRTRNNGQSPRLPAAGVLWILLLALAPLAVAVIMGPKGVVGFVAGLGIAALIESLRPHPHPQALSLGLGVSAIASLGFAFLGDSAMLTREQKMGLLLPMAVVATLLVVLLTFFSPRPSLKEAEAK